MERRIKAGASKGTIPADQRYETGAEAAAYGGGPH